MSIQYQIDNLDLNIIHVLQQDARTSFLDIARRLDVSGGTIHQRVDRLKKAGVLKGSKFVVDHSILGHRVTVLLGIHVRHARDIEDVVAQIERFPEVTQAYYTTGTFAIMVIAIVKDIDDYHRFLVKGIQSIPQVQSTESFICLNKMIDRDFSPSTSAH